MTSSNSNSSWYYTLLTIVLSVGFFLLFKSLLPSKLFPEPNLASEHVTVDEWMQQALAEESDSLRAADSTSFTTKLEPLLEEQSPSEAIAVDSTSQTPKDTLPVESFAFTEGEEEFYLNHFYKSLAALQENPNSKKVRIAYFGDSMTDGDRIVQDLREYLQSKYGGAGVGFVSVTSESASSRGSISHKYSNNWQEYTYIKTYDTVYPFGVAGQVFYQTDTLEPTSLQFSSGIYSKSKNLAKPELFYSKSKNQNAKLKVVTQSDTIWYSLKPEKDINQLSLGNGNIQKLELEFIDADSVPIYGVNFDTPYGIQVDNFSKRGNSGLPITQLDSKLMRAFQSSLNYDLIILHYGTNVLQSSSFKYGWYQSRMERVVDHLRAAFPQTSIMVVSIADKATKYDTQMQTDSAVAYLLSAQKALATKKKTGFINLYELMGGEGSMVTWVEELPERANKDYTHFNHRGSKEIAKMIYNQIDTGYKSYAVKMAKLEAEKEQQRIQDSILKAKEEERKLQEIREALQLKQDSIYVTED